MYLSGVKKAVTLQLFHHVVATFDGTVSKLYLDGVAKEGAEPVPGSLPALDFPLRVGQQSSNNYGPFLGVIDELAIYKEALSASTIEEHYTLTQ